MEVSRQVLTQAFDAGDPNLTVAYLKSTISQENFHRVEVRDKASGAALFGPLSSRASRWLEACADLDMGTRYGAELVACRGALGYREILSCLLFALTVAFVVGLGIRFIRKELADWSDGLSATLERLRALGFASIEEALSSGALGGEPVRELSQLRRRIIEILAESKRLIEFEATARIAAQVAHDIQSPLAALESLAEAGAAGDGNVAADALSRMRGIVDDLRRREKGAVVRGRFDPARLLRALAAEKRAQYRARAGLLLDEVLRAEGATLDVDERELGRVVSNLLNNAVEALPEEGGRVALFLEAVGASIEIRVVDDGRGIAPEIQPRLALEGATFGKEGGSGLGLYHARKTLESWGGRLEISSELGRGTVVRLIIPSRDAAPSLAILIDDDPLVRATWKAAAVRAGKTLHAFQSVADFLRAASAVDRETPVYIDAELGDGVRGEEMAREICESGFTSIYLATGHEPGRFAGMKHLSGVVGKTPPWS